MGKQKSSRPQPTLDNKVIFKRETGWQSATVDSISETAEKNNKQNENKSQTIMNGGEKRSTVDTRKIEDSYEKDSIDNEEKKSYNIGEENKRSEYTGEITSYNEQERKSVQRNNRQGGSMESEGLHTLSGKPTVKNDTEGAESSIRERKSKAKRTRLTSDQLNSEQRRIVEQNRIEFAKNTYFSTTPLSGDYFVDGDEIWLYSGDFEDNDLHFKNGTASFTEDRLKSLISEYSVKNYSDYSKDYAKAYVAYISPDEFISLTTSMPERIEAEALDRYKSLNEDSLKESGNIFLIADFESGEVEGHEERHRMVLLKNAGIERVAIVIKDSRMGDSVKYNTDKKTNLTLTGESFARGRKATGEVTLDEVIPLSPRFRDEVNRKFVSNDDIGVKYSTVDTRKLGEELDGEKAEGKTDGEVTVEETAGEVTDKGTNEVTDGVTDGDEGLNADGMGDAEGGDEVGDRERILPEYNSRGQKVSKFAETVADVGMRLNEAGRTEEGTDMVEAAKRIAENPVEYKTEPMSHEVTAKNNKIIILPIEIDGRSKSNNLRIDSNAITSSYGRNHLETKIKNALTDESQGKIVYSIGTKKKPCLYYSGLGSNSPGHCLKMALSIVYAKKALLSRLN